MEIDDLRGLNDEDLSEELNESRRVLMNLRIRAATMQLANMNELKKVRKRIARIQTIMRERELARATG